MNCCDPLLFGDGVQGNCVDSAETVRQLERLAEHGIPTYVIGLPGTELFADVLNRMAEAGGAAREGEASAYYDVGDQDELETALYSIGSGLAIRCSIELEEAPLDPDKVNVYFDGKIVEADPDNGWSWDGDTRIQVNGQHGHRRPVNLLAHGGSSQTMTAYVYAAGMGTRILETM